MAISPETVIERFEELKKEAAGRNAAWDELWKRYTGEFYEFTAVEQLGGIRLTAPLISEHVTKHTEMFAFPPGIEVPPPDATEDGKRRADVLEKALYAVWEANAMDRQLLVIGCYLALFGVFFIRVFPEPLWEGKVRLYVCDPRECYPEVSARGWQTIRRMFWEHEVLGGEIKELYPDAKGTWEVETPYAVIEFWDEREFALIEKDSKKVLKKGDHPIGRVPFTSAQNKPLPKKEYGLSDVEHAVGLEDFFRHFLSTLADVAEYYADPIVVMRGARYGTEQKPGPGGMISVDLTGGAEFLTWQGTPPISESILNRIYMLIADLCGVAPQRFGVAGGAVESGAAVSRLLSSGQTPRLQMKQIQAGGALSEANEIVLRLIETLWGQHGVKLKGRRREVPFEVEIKASDIKGYYRNFIRWEAGLWDYAQRLQVTLQQVGAGLKSRYSAMEDLGIRSPLDERKRILEEQKQEIEHQKALAALVQPTEMRMPGEIAREGRQIEKGGLPRRMRFSPPRKGGGGAAPTEGEEEGEEGETKGGRLLASEVLPAFTRIDGLRGNAYLIGGIVTEGYTERDIDILVENRADVPKILRQLEAALGRKIRGRIHFSPTKAEPTSPHVTVKGTTGGGGLKPQAVKPFRLVPVAKPEKKAFTTNEAFSIQALRQKLPEGHTWDVSGKMDGIRCQLHRVGDKIRLFSDEAHEIAEAKIAALLAEARKTLPERCILDGELMLYLNEQNQHHEGVVRYLRTKETDPREAAGIRYAFWDILWNGGDLTGRPFGERSKILGSDQKGRIFRVKHTEASLENLPKAIREVQTPEGAMIRSLQAAYWATHLLFKYKKMFDVDVTVVEVKPTKAGAERYVAADREGNIVGVTYAVSHLKGKVKKGDVITVSVQKVGKRVQEGKEKFHWFSPVPSATTAIRRKGADPQSVFAEIWKETRGKYMRGGLKETEAR